MSYCDDCNLIERLGERVLTDEECEELLELLETNRAYSKRERENKEAKEYLKDAEEFQVLSAKDIDMAKVDNGEDD